LFSWVRASAAAPLADGVGEQQLATAGGVQHVDGVGGALVGDGERAQLAHLVAPELNAHGVLGGGREDVDDPAAHRELAARGDHLDAGVGQLDQPHQQVVEVVVSPTPQAHGVERAQAGRDRLDQAAGGGDDQPRRGVGSASAGRSRAAADRVRRGREPLVREGLPARQHRDGVLVQQLRRRRAEVFGLAVGGGDGQHRAVPVAPMRRGEERAQRGRALHAQGGRLAVRRSASRTACRSGWAKVERSRPEKLGHDRDFP
jgi:hypothetical protein